MNKRSFLPLLAVLVLAGCVQTQATLLSNQKYPPIEPDDVVIYMSEDDIPGDYEKVAIIHAQGETDFTNESQMLKAMRKRAAKVGANGVLLPAIDEPSTGAKIAGAVLGVSTERRGETLAIYVFGETAQR